MTDEDRKLVLPRLRKIAKEIGLDLEKVLDKGLTSEAMYELSRF